MSEPTYNYVKGVGWVPQVHETFTGNIGLYRVTISTELPQEGDYYGYGAGYTPETLWKEASTTYRHHFDDPNVGLIKYHSRASWMEGQLFKLTLEIL